MARRNNDLFKKLNIKDGESLREADDSRPILERAKIFAEKAKKRWQASKRAGAVRHLSTKYVLAGLLAVCIALIILSVTVDNFTAPFKAAASFVIEPAQNGVNKLGLWISDRIARSKSISELREENESLEEEVNRLLSVNETLRQNENELNRLRELLDLKGLYSEYDMVAAQVVAKDSSGYFSTFTINKGSHDGIEADMNVIADGALVGIITDVGINYSIVRAIIDDESNVSGQFQTSGAVCNVSGDLTLMDNNLIEFSQVSVNEEIEIHDTVLTSYISSKYLPGLIIGYVASYETDANELTQSGYITPAADFTGIREVLIITTLKETWDSESVSETAAEAETVVQTETETATEESPETAGENND